MALLHLMCKRQILVLIVYFLAVGILLWPSAWLYYYEDAGFIANPWHQAFVKHYFTVQEILTHPVIKLALLIISIFCGVALAFLELKKKK
jgi:hypothetical protein